MAKVTMTVQEALAKKKIYEAQIAKALSVSSRKVFVTSATKTQEIILGHKRDECETKLKAMYISIRHLIDNLSNLKVAINHSNATTEIVVAGKTYTIADAIAKLHSLDSEKEFFTIISNQYSNILKEIDVNNKRNLSPEAISEYVSKMTSGRSSESSKKDETLYNALVESYKENNTLEIVDPVGYDKILVEWEKDISDFEANIHNALITSNVSTIIEVELND